MDKITDKVEKNDKDMQKPKRLLNSKNLKIESNETHEKSKLNKNSKKKKEIERKNSEKNSTSKSINHNLNNSKTQELNKNQDIDQIINNTEETPVIVEEVKMKKFVLNKDFFNSDSKKSK